MRKENLKDGEETGIVKILFFDMCSDLNARHPKLEDTTTQLLDRQFRGLHGDRSQTLQSTIISN